MKEKKYWTDCECLGLKGFFCYELNLREAFQFNLGIRLLKSKEGEVVK